MKEGGQIERGIVRSNDEVAPDHRILAIELPPSFGEGQPGQFVMLRPGECRDPFLSRPFSIYTMDRDGESVHLYLLYRVVGKGTVLMASLRRGDTVMLLGPLGRGFDPPGEAEKAVLVAGGVGVAPLVCYAERARKTDSGRALEITAYVGARTEGMLVGLDRLEALCDVLKVATDDGSRGYNGTVTELFRRDLDKFRPPGSVVKACGPKGMTDALRDIVEREGLYCQVSLEERMACGIGVCLGCAVRVKGDDAEPAYLRVCKDGPVFDTGVIYRDDR